MATEYDIACTESSEVIIARFQEWGTDLVKARSHEVDFKRLQEAETKEEIQTQLAVEWAVAYYRNQAELCFEKTPKLMGKMEDAAIEFAKWIRKLDCNSYFARRVNDLLDDIEELTDRAQHLTK